MLQPHRPLGAPGVNPRVGGRAEWVSGALKWEWTVQEVVNFAVDGLIVVEF